MDRHRPDRTPTASPSGTALQAGDADRLATYVDAQCAMLGLELAPAHRPGVLVYLALVESMAPLVMDFALPVHVESGNVFRPVTPRAVPTGVTTPAPEHGR